MVGTSTSTGGVKSAMLHITNSLKVQVQVPLPLPVRLIDELGKGKFP